MRVMDSDKSDQRLAGAKHLLLKSALLREGDSVLLVFDRSTAPLVRYFEKAASEAGLALQCVENHPQNNHGEEPSEEVRELMESFPVSVSLTEYSLAHTTARLKASQEGHSFLSLPQYSLGLLGHEMIRVDYQSLSPRVDYLADVLTKGSRATVLSPGGTSLSLNLEGRRGNSCPAWLFTSGSLGSPPDVEANISPCEEFSEGRLVVDGSITHPSIGLLSSPVTLQFTDGILVSHSSSEKRVMDALDSLFPEDEPKRRVLAELGFGMNPLAVLTGSMLSDEGALGTGHIGLGSNFSVGGLNQVPFHLDFVFKKVTLIVDSVEIIKDGVLKFE